MRFRSSASLSLIVLISGCAAFGVVESSDPLVKLNDSQYLFQNLDRPLPAERLIFEALEIYKGRDDPHGMGHCYRQYGELLLSPTVEKHHKTYRENGFQDRSVTFDTRKDKAKEYFAKAIPLYEKAVARERAESKFDALTNTYVNLGVVQFHLEQREEACKYYGLAIEAYRQNMKLNPDAKPLSPGAKSVPDELERVMKVIGC